ncbi:MAG: COG1361 S-layer family protein [Candidatus Nanohaloarchaea archaeon]
MKKYIAIAILLMVPFTYAAPEPVITVQNVEPQPSEPGDTVELSVLVKNEGDRSARFSPLGVETVEGVRFIGTTSGFRKSFSLCGGCQKTGLLYFKVKESADTGRYPVDLNISSGRYGVVEKFRLSVDGEPNLVINSGRIEMTPGENVTTKVEIENIGSDEASQVVLGSASDTFSVSPPETVLGEVKPGETVEKRLRVSADESTDSGLKSLELSLDYRDESESGENTVKLPVKVLEKAELTVSDVEVEKAVIGKETTVTAEIENLGPGEAEQIVSSLECEGARVKSGKSFVGQLEDEENVPMVFTVEPESVRAECTLRTEFRDHSQRKIKEEFSFSSSKQNSIILPAIAAVLVIAALGFYWRKRRKDELEEV